MSRPARAPPTLRGAPLRWHRPPDAPLPTVALFSLVGFTQMTIWAKGKHRSYLKEFRDYPPLRMPIVPFLL